VLSCRHWTVFRELHTYCYAVHRGIKTLTQVSFCHTLGWQHSFLHEPIEKEIYNGGTKWVILWI
jgi:hypothetical protein